MWMLPNKKTLYEKIFQKYYTQSLQSLRNNLFWYDWAIVKSITIRIIFFVIFTYMLKNSIF